jgi:MtN3 and saliva related transmembrane protein
MIDTTELLGFFSAFCTTLAFLPHVIKILKSKSASDLSLPMFVLFEIGVSGWLIYGILIINWPMILANSITLILASIILVYKLKYG